jgi:hypothetical protein
MNQQTVIYIIVGSAVTGVAYFLYKQEQNAAGPSSSGLEQVLTFGLTGVPGGGALATTPGALTWAEQN